MRNLLFWLSGLNYHLPLVKVTHGCTAKAYHMMGKVCFQPTTTHRHKHTSRNRHTCVRLHTPTHTQSSAVSATRPMLGSHTHAEARISTIELSAGNEAVPDLYLRGSPHPLIRNVTACTVSLSGQIHQNRRVIDTLTSLLQRPIAPPSTVLTSVSSASLMHLRTSQCYPTLQKEVDLSQSVSCRVFHTSHAVVCVHSALSPLFSLALSLRPARRTIHLFRFTLTIDHFW